MTIITLIIVAATSTAPGQPLADLCDLAYTSTGTPTFCEPHPDGAPHYDDTVCCDTQGCVIARAGSCDEKRKPYYCELGEVWASGEVTCYFEVPSYCDVFPCEPGFQTWPQELYLCCYEGICWELSPSGDNCEPLNIYWCQDGVSNPDGTITCLDE